MTSFTLNNENKTEVTFEYDNGLPYKERIRPSIEYGDLVSDDSKALIKINLTKEEYNDLNNKEVLLFKKIFFINDEIWFDMDNIYMIIKSENYLSTHIKSCKFIISFYIENKIINSYGNK